MLLLPPCRAPLAVFALLLATACSRAPGPSPYGLDCALGEGTSGASCAHVAERQQVRRPELTGARELVLTALSARRTGTHLVVDATLRGAFRNAADQNLYLFLGEASEGPPTPYALTADPQYAADVGYPVRIALDVPHRLDVRVGLMAPEVSGYTPQVYVRDAVQADAVGPDAQVVQRVDGPRVHVEVPLERYYRLKGAPVPRALSVTVATARDYVGFVDSRTVPALGQGGSGEALPRQAEPALYPSLDVRSHRFKAVALSREDGTTTVSLDAGAHRLAARRARGLRPAAGRRPRRLRPHLLLREPLIPAVD